MAEHINIRLKVGQGYFRNYVLTWVLSRQGFARFAVDLSMVNSECRPRTGSMVSFEFPLILSPKCTQITIFLQIIHEPVKVLKGLQNNIDSS